MHAYCPHTGAPKHSIATKAGAKNTSRPTTMKDVKAHGWYPSVTSILGDISAPDLSHWKEEQLLKAAFVQPPIHAEDYAAWASGIRERATAGTVEAAEYGVEVHKALELAILNGCAPELPGAKAGYSLLQNLALQEIKAETTAVNNALGYAGTVDVSAYLRDPDGMLDMPTLPVILDFKTKRTEPKKKIKPPETYLWQLAAYHLAVFGVGQRELHPHARAANIFISSTEPERPAEIVWYERGDLERGLEAFLCAHRLFCIRHNYTPKTSR